MAKSQFLRIFKERGFFHQCTDEKGLDRLLASEPVTAYIGFDCTATSLHVGSLMQIMVLRWLSRLGHKPIILLGGATTKIGDPSGKDESRPKITDETIAHNMAGIRKVFDQFGLESAQMVNNDDWYQGFLLSLMDLSEHFSVKKMLTFDSVKNRMEREEAPLSLKEFLYMVLQAYDFVELSMQHNCRLQIGGSDQWGNIVNGVELGRHFPSEQRIEEAKKCKESLENKYPGIVLEGIWPLRLKRLPGGLDGSQAGNILAELSRESSNLNLFGLTTPLITTSSGAKMGKTADGAVWLSADKFSPYDYWQFWRNVDDKDVGRFLLLFTELEIPGIGGMLHFADISTKDELFAALSQADGATINKAKIILAGEATKICHGEDAAKQAFETARKVFEQGGVGADLPTVEISKSELEAGIPAFKMLHMANLVDSGGEAKNLIKGGGAKINDIKISDIAQNINMAVFIADGIIKLSAGRKKHALIRAV